MPRDRERTGHPAADGDAADPVSLPARAALLERTLK
jgi:hypothetical protein